MKEFERRKTCFLWDVIDNCVSGNYCYLKLYPHTGVSFILQVEMNGQPRTYRYLDFEDTPSLTTFNPDHLSIQFRFRDSIITTTYENLLIIPDSIYPNKMKFKIDWVNSAVPCRSCSLSVSVMTVKGHNLYHCVNCRSLTYGLRTDPYTLIRSHYHSTQDY